MRLQELGNWLHLLARQILPINPFLVGILRPHPEFCDRTAGYASLLFDSEIYQNVQNLSGRNILFFCLPALLHCTARQSLSIWRQCVDVAASAWLRPDPYNKDSEMAPNSGFTQPSPCLHMSNPSHLRPLINRRQALLNNIFLECQMLFVVIVSDFTPLHLLFWPELKWGGGERGGSEAVREGTMAGRRRDVTLAEFDPVIPLDRASIAAASPSSSLGWHDR